MRVATYGRYSSALQRETSLDDQIAAARTYAEQHGWEVLPDHLYTDAAVSGSSIEGRPGLRALMTAAQQKPKPFDIVLADDSSRVARDLADALRTMQTLKFHGVRVIYISQGIDSASEQADAMVAVHGLIDQLYIKELAQKIKRGLAGQLERGFVTGGKTYGYRTVPVPSGKTDVNGNPELLGKHRVIEPAEAEIVRRIYDWSGSGVGVHTIVRKLRESLTPPPWGGTWSSNGIRTVLHNEAYLGRLVWGRTSQTRQPGTNKSVCKRIPREQWKVKEAPELRIVSDEQWQRVRARSADIAVHLESRNLSRGRPPRSASRHLMSGFMTCGACGKSIVAVSSSKGYGPRYGCYGGHRAHTCSNKLEIGKKRLEGALLAGLQKALRRPEVLDYIVQATGKALASRASAATDITALQRQLEKDQKKLQNLVRALEHGESSTAVMGAIRGRESAIASLNAQIANAQTAIPTDITVSREGLDQHLSDLASLLDSDLARTMLTKLDYRAVLTPREGKDGRPYLHATVTCTLKALAGEIPLLRRGRRPFLAHQLPILHASLARAVRARSSSRVNCTSSASGATVRSAR